MLDLPKLIAVVRTAAAAYAPGASAAIEAATAVVELVQSVRTTLGSHDQAALDAALEPLLAKMNKDVDQAISDLGGTG